MRPVFGSTATTAPLYRPRAETAAARTIGSSYEPSSALEESAKVGTPRYLEREADLCVRVAGFPAAGAAGKGTTHIVASSIARIDLANCLTVSTFLRVTA